MLRLSCMCVAVVILMAAATIGWHSSGSEAEGEPRSIPASQLVNTWWLGDRDGDSGRAALALYSIYDELALVLPAAVNGDLNDQKRAVKIGPALRLVERFRVPEAIPVMLSRLRVQPPGGNIQLGAGSEVEQFPYAMCLAVIGRDSVPHIIDHLSRSRQLVEAVQEEDIILLARVLSIVYASRHRECIAVLREYSAAPNVQRLLDAYMKENNL